jgi:hypothetical protein
VHFQPQRRCALPSSKETLRGLRPLSSPKISEVRGGCASDDSCVRSVRSWNSHSTRVTNLDTVNCVCKCFVERTFLTIIYDSFTVWQTPKII